MEVALAGGGATISEPRTHALAHSVEAGPAGERRTPSAATRRPANTTGMEHAAAGIERSRQTLHEAGRDSMYHYLYKIEF